MRALCDNTPNMFLTDFDALTCPRPPPTQIPILRYHQILRPCANPPPHSHALVRPDTPIHQAQGREPGRMFALPQPDRRLLTWGNEEGRKGPDPEPQPLNTLTSGLREHDLAH